MENNGGQRFNSTHKACGAKFSVFAWKALDPNQRDRNGWRIEFWQAEGQRFEQAPDGSNRLVFTCECGVKLYARPVLGKVNKVIACNSKCQASTGHSCECSCGGKFHGASHG